MKKINENKAYVIDTSAIIEKIPSIKVNDGSIKEGKILVPHAVVAELENQANRGRDIGLIGLEEIQELRSLCEKNKKLTLEFIGERPSEHQIRHAKHGEIDAYIRSMAQDFKATLITADLIQAASAKALGIQVDYVKVVKYQEELTLQKYIDNTTMSLHLKEGHYVMAKRGKPGDWKLEQLTKVPLKSEEVQDYAKEI